MQLVIFIMVSLCIVLPLVLMVRELSKNAEYNKKDMQAWEDFVNGKVSYYDKTWFYKKFE